MNNHHSNSKDQRIADLEKSISDIYYLINEHENQLIAPVTPEQKLHANHRLEELNQLLAIQQEKLEQLNSSGAKTNIGKLEITETAPNEIQKKLDEIKNEVRQGVKELKIGQNTIYQLLSNTRNQELQEIIQATREGNIQQDYIKEILRKIQQAIVLIETSQQKLSTELLTPISDASSALESELSLQGKLELTLPIIPLLLDYKVELAATDGIKLNELWDSLKKTFLHKSNQDPHPEQLDLGTKEILSKIEHSNYNPELSPENKLFLKRLFTEARKPELIGEIEMNNISEGQAADIFVKTSRSVAYFLSSLAEYHAKWSRLRLADPTTEQSIEMLDAIQDQIYLISGLVQQYSGPQEFRIYEYESRNVLSSVNQLQRLLDDINRYLISGNIPADISLQIERLFDDLVLYISRYLITINDLASSINNKNSFLQ